jgi:hypothetical protein
MSNGTQSHFRFRNDNGNETTATWLAAVDTNISMTMQEVFRARFAYIGTGSSWNFDLYYSYNGGAYTAVTNSSIIQVVPSAQGAGFDGTATTQQISSGTFNAGAVSASSSSYATGSIFVGNTNLTEIEFCLQIPTGLNVGDTIALKLYLGSGAITLYSSIATITITGAASPGITVLSSAINTSATANTTYATIDSRGANLLVMTVTGLYSANFLASLTESGVVSTNTWNSVVIWNSGTTTTTAMYYALPASTANTGGSHKVSFTTSSLQLTVGFFALSGAADTPKDATNSTTWSIGTTLSTGSVTPNGGTTGEFVITALCNYNNSPGTCIIHHGCCIFGWGNSRCWCSLGNLFGWYCGWSYMDSTKW